VVKADAETLTKDSGSACCAPAAGERTELPVLASAGAGSCC
jgi:hypothetical protein